MVAVYILWRSSPNSASRWEHLSSPESPRLAQQSTLRVLMRRVVRAVLLSALFLRILYAQSTNASLTGRITDPNKAVIGSAKVTAINTGTDIHYQGLTNDTGTYYISN